jgi:hypothetical protein
VSSVGTLKVFAALARPTTLLMTVWVSWLRRPAKLEGLVVDQDQCAVVRGKQGVETSVLVHVGAPSGWKDLS